MTEQQFNPLGPHFTEQGKFQVKKVIIRTRHQDLTPAMRKFGNNCVDNFVGHLEAETYGKDWCDCAYSSGVFSGWVTLNKGGTISALVISKVVEPCS